MQKKNTIDKFQDECGVFGIFSKNELDISTLTYTALNALQHRGQESCGIAVFNDKKINYLKGMGLVSDVFNDENLKALKGSSAIGHVRYSTFGGSNLQNAQPIISDNYNKQLAIAHNGNITNALNLRRKLETKGIKFKTSTDSEVILKIIENDNREPLEDPIVKLMWQVKGGYSVLICTEEKLIGFRDPNGIRPLCIGKLKDSFILSSESCALNSIGAELIRDVLPGEIITIDRSGLKSSYFDGESKNGICAFEYIYFSRPDSIIDKVGVYKSRVEVGMKLWEESPVSGDIVIGVPDSGIASAIGFAKASGIPYDLGFVRNQYIGRTFIEPLKKVREANVEMKLSPIKSAVQDKRVIVVDDSIVRGTTSEKIITSLKMAGAKEIHFRVASPVIKYPCLQGINTPNSSELIGSTNTVDEIRKSIGADSLEYISINGLIEALGNNKEVCLKCFNK